MTNISGFREMIRQYYYSTLDSAMSCYKTSPFLTVVDCMRYSIVCIDIIDALLSWNIMHQRHFDHFLDPLLLKIALLQSERCEPRIKYDIFLEQFDDWFAIFSTIMCLT